MNKKKEIKIMEPVDSQEEIPLNPTGSNDAGIPGLVSYTDADMNEELERLDSYRVEQNLWREDDDGGIGLPNSHGHW